ncbi:isopeptide-forming domain-containing fimbrial protein [Streptococcus anginosus]|uniref:Cna protein B-type domain protein n=1 Tax=Streptococcus anginosus subsp. whileyi CCUG 39159 TaxID=1095729 RepID=I0S513_STRAP|nr:isopeptide-forming domain-containing fimbrial protein [Streptococcus anginosus]EID18466.1 Cna protein B-type domain protein [Streptococcus anginosus subsp. whileyi CCUG 39159]QQT08525.1 isopeptide-forming domain-containing fimbrial protein [Streptococcus anginosus]
MKKLRFILATFVAVFLAFTGSKALADTYTITIKGDTAGHTYEAYQIFKGNLSGDTLSDIQWGDGVTGFSYKGKSDAAEVASVLTDSNATEFAAEAAKHLKTPSGSGTTSITGLSAGYYLIKDKENSLTGNKAYTSFILKVVGNKEIKPKADIPSVVKKVKDINDSTDSQMSDWQDSADHDFGDHVPFQLTATLPSNYASYKEYYLSFVDTLSAGLKYDKNAKVYVVNGSQEQEVTKKFTIDENGASYKINNLKSITNDDTGQPVSITSSSKIVVRYTATLTTEAKIGSAGNPNTVHLEYSNNPNYTGNGENSPKGETPKDTVIVFTYKTVVNKVDQNKQPLAGAKFKLEKKLVNGSYKEVATVSTTAGSKFEFKGLDDGEYRLTETETPAGYNSIAPITFKVTASHETESDMPKLTDLNGEKVSGEIKFEKDVNAGSLTTDVVNKKGSLLPNTGGIGTTILYLAGSILVVGAGILLVTKKRMETK